MIIYLRNFNSTAPVDYQKMKDIFNQIKSENKLEKKTDDWFEWLSWGEKGPQNNESNPQNPSQEKIPPANLQNPNNNANNNTNNLNNMGNNNAKKKPLDYAINLLPINEEEAKNQVQKNRLTEKLQHLDDIKFKNAFARRNSPKKMFIPLSTLTDEKVGAGLTAFNSLQEIPIVETKDQLKSMQFENLDTGEISPQKLSDKVKSMMPQNFNFK